MSEFSSSVSAMPRISYSRKIVDFNMPILSPRTTQQGAIIGRFAVRATRCALF
jgi:hypothetical protein